MNETPQADAGADALLDITADADLQPPTLDDDRRKAYNERDKAKAAARKLEAELAAAREMLALVDGTAATIREARTVEAIRNIDPKLHGAARAVLQVAGLDLLSADLGAVAKALQAAGLTPPRNFPAGAPGANHSMLPEAERPPTPGEVARALGQRLSTQPNGPMPSELAHRAGGQVERQSAAEVRALADRLNAQVRAGQAGVVRGDPQLTAKPRPKAR